MVDSAANPVDGPTKLEQREAADNDDRYINTVTARRARNLRDYHQAEINRLSRAIEEHQAVVDAQEEILSNAPEEEDTTSPSSLDDGTSIRDQFDTDAHSPDADPNLNADPVNPDDNEGNGDGQGEGGTGGGKGASHPSTSPSSDDLDEVLNTPVPVADTEPANKSKKGK